MPLEDDASTSSRSSFITDLADADFSDVAGTPGVTTSAADSQSADNDFATNAAPSTEPAAAPAAPTDPNLLAADRRAAAAAPTASAEAPSWQGVRQAAESVGYKFGPEVADDNAALLHLIRQANTSQQENYYAQLGRQLAPHAPKIQGYLDSQKTPVSTEPKPWEAPKFDPRWATLVERDPTSGIVLGKPGTPPEIVDAANKYVAWKDAYDRDPAGVISGMVEARASEVAEKLFTNRFAEIEQRQAVSEIQRANSEWLYARDANGNAMRGHDGRYLPSAAGSRYLAHVHQAVKMGVTDPRHQDQIARTYLQLEIAQANAAHSASTAAQANSPQAAQARTQPNVNSLGTLPPSQRAVTPGATEPSGAGLSLAQTIRNALNAEGIGDEAFQNVHAA